MHSTTAEATHDAAVPASSEGGSQYPGAISSAAAAPATTDKPEEGGDKPQEDTPKPAEGGNAEASTGADSKDKPAEADKNPGAGAERPAQEGTRTEADNTDKPSDGEARPEDKKPEEQKPEVKKDEEKPAEGGDKPAADSKDAPGDKDAAPAGDKSLPTTTSITSIISSSSSSQSSDSPTSTAEPEPQSTTTTVIDGKTIVTSLPCSECDRFPTPIASAESNVPAPSADPMTEHTTVIDGKTTVTTLLCTECDKKDQPSAAAADAEQKDKEKEKPPEPDVKVNAPGVAAAAESVDRKDSPKDEEAAANGEKKVENKEDHTTSMTISTTVVDGKTLVTTVPRDRTAVDLLDQPKDAAPTTHEQKEKEGKKDDHTSSMTTSTTIVDGKTLITIVPCDRSIIDKHGQPQDASATSPPVENAPTPSVNPIGIGSTSPTSASVTLAVAEKKADKKDAPPPAGKVAVTEYTTMIVSTSCATSVVDGKTSVSTSFITTVSPTSVREAPLLTVIDHSTQTVSSICSTFTEDGKEVSSTTYITSLIPTDTRSGALVTMTQYSTSTVSCNKCGSITSSGTVLPASVTPTLVPISTHIGFHSTVTAYSTKTVSTSCNTITRDGKVFTQTSFITTLQPTASSTTIAPVPSVLAASAQPAPAPAKTETDFITKTLAQAVTTITKDGKVETTSTPVVTVVPATVTQWTTQLVTQSCAPFTSAGTTFSSTVITSVSPVGYTATEWKTVTVTQDGQTVIQMIQSFPSPAPAPSPSPSPSVLGAAQGQPQPQPQAQASALSTTTYTSHSITGTKLVTNTYTSTIYAPGPVVYATTKSPAGLPLEKDKEVKELTMPSSCPANGSASVLGIGLGKGANGMNGTNATGSLFGISGLNKPSLMPFNGTAVRGTVGWGVLGIGMGMAVGAGVLL